jgi:hypothetical protein
MIGQRSHQRRTDTLTALLGKDPRCGEASAYGVGPVGQAGADDGAVAGGEKQHPARRVLRPKLGDGGATLTRHHGDPNSPPRFIVTVRDADG